MANNSNNNNKNVLTKEQSRLLDNKRLGPFDFNLLSYNLTEWLSLLSFIATIIIATIINNPYVFSIIEFKVTLGVVLTVLSQTANMLYVFGALTIQDKKTYIKMLVVSPILLVIELVIFLLISMNFKIQINYIEYLKTLAAVIISNIIMYVNYLKTDVRYMKLSEVGAYSIITRKKR